MANTARKQRGGGTMVDFGLDLIPQQHPTWRDRLALAQSRLSRAPVEIAFYPEPLSIGCPERGRKFLNHTFFSEGREWDMEECSPWDSDGLNDDFTSYLHGFEWLDDVAALSEMRAKRMAAQWAQDWAMRFGNGQGQGWTAALAGRRLVRLLSYSKMISHKNHGIAPDVYVQLLMLHVKFLSRAWARAPYALEQIEALTGLCYGAFCLTGMERQQQIALASLTQFCASLNPQGPEFARSPERLLHGFARLGWIAEVLRHGDIECPASMSELMGHMGEALRGLRHCDGSLPRFHGSGAGGFGALDTALARDPVRRLPQTKPYMGYACLRAGGCSVVIDSDMPPAQSAQAHASTLAFEMCSGRVPLVVNCGAGQGFGPEWQHAARATPSHSTLVLDGVSSSTIGGQHEYLERGPQALISDGKCGTDRLLFEAGHDGWRSNYGLIHGRALRLARDGAALRGTDTLATLTDADHVQFDKASKMRAGRGIPFDIRFHLHPDVQARIENGRVVLELPDGSFWRFEWSGEVDNETTATISPSFYLDNRQEHPLSAQQVVLSGLVLSYVSHVNWALIKVQG